MATHGEIRWPPVGSSDWPPMGRFSWPPSVDPAEPPAERSTGPVAAVKRSYTVRPPDRADRGDRAQVLDQHPVDGESALA